MLTAIKRNSCIEPNFTLCALCLVLMSPSLLACYSSGQHYDWQITKVKFPVVSNYFATEKNSKVKKIKDIVDKYKEMGLHGFPPSDKVVKKWRDWYKDYKKKTKNADFFNKKNRDRLKAERDAEGGWPGALQWLDLGEGLGGTPVPPWAYVLKNSGLPQACMQPIQRENKCFDPSMGNWKRGGFGYHPYRGTCVFYESYTCQYNINFFHSKEYCDQYCSYARPASFCNMANNVPIDYTYIYDQ
ncbi:uncharacterized protein LOC111350572 [Spodoptera litura]|uniref:Uncharacterized protein LOC111350572 n=1 Tax=Spodoptera litura TaxID=69820 RepID=A0A9J7DT80_SPOLT|nr:uncharacterized protein LOC111350572 [Spodoptera litura]